MKLAKAAQRDKNRQHSRMGMQVSGGSVKTIANTQKKRSNQLKMQRMMKANMQNDSMGGGCLDTTETTRKAK